MKSTTEKLFDEAIARKAGDRVTIRVLADAINAPAASLYAPMAKLVDAGVFRKTGEIGTAGVNGVIKPTNVYEVTGRLPDLKFNQRRRPKHSKPVPQVPPAKPGPKTLTEAEKDALALALLERVPDKVLKAEIERRKHKPNGNLPPRVATLLGMGA